MGNVTKYGHGDVLDEFYYWGLILTQFCASDQSQDGPTFRQFIAAEIWSYVSMVVHQDCQHLPFIEDSSMMPVETIAFSKSSVSSDWRCGEESRCQYYEPRFILFYTHTNENSHHHDILNEAAFT